MKTASSLLIFLMRRSSINLEAVKWCPVSINIALSFPVIRWASACWWDQLISSIVQVTSSWSFLLQPMLAKINIKKHTDVFILNLDICVGGDSSRISNQIHFAQYRIWLLYLNFVNSMWNRKVLPYSFMNYVKRRGLPPLHSSRSLRLRNQGQWFGHLPRSNRCT